MSDNLPTKTETKLPTIAELFSENIEVAGKSEALNVLLNNPPPLKWIKEHPFIKVEGPMDENGSPTKVPYKYLPIDKIEYLLRKIFKSYRIEVLREGTAFNGVYVVVRVHYFNPATGVMEWHDGIGAAQLQTKKGTSPADLINVNNGAVSMAFPMAKTLAVKDACDHFGIMFGANLNRKDTLGFTPDLDLIKQSSAPTVEELETLFNEKKASLSPETIESATRIIQNKETKSYKKLFNLLSQQ